VKWIITTVVILTTFVLDGCCETPKKKRSRHKQKHTSGEIRILERAVIRTLKPPIPPTPTPPPTNEE
jgi:hypothetical protein